MRSSVFIVLPHRTACCPWRRHRDLKVQRPGQDDRLAHPAESVLWSLYLRPRQFSCMHLPWVSPHAQLRALEHTRECVYIHTQSHPPTQESMVPDLK